MSAASSEVGSPPVPPSRWRANWRVALLVLIAAFAGFFAAEFFGSLIVGVLLGLFGPSGAAAAPHWLSETGAEFLYGLLADGFLLGVVALLLRRLGWRWQSIGFRRPTLVQILLGVAAIVPYLAIYALLAGIVKTAVPSLNFDQQQEIGFQNVYGVAPLVMAAISLVILPPLAEEAMMRGLLYTGLRRALPWTAAGLVVSVLFGAAHLAEGGASGLLWIGAIDTFSLSLVLVYLREKTGSLWPGIVLHALKNGIAFFILFIIGGR